MTINPQKFYRITEVLDLSKEGFFPIQTRQGILDQIDLGKLNAVNAGKGKKPYYKIQGSELLMFLESVSSLEIQNVSRGRTKKEKTKSSQVS